MDIGKYYDAPSFADYSVGGLKLFVFLAFLALGWALWNRLTSFDDHEEMFEKQNYRLAVIRVGIAFGQALSMLPLLGVSSDPWWESVLWQLAFNVWALVLFAGMRPILERVVKRAKSRADNIREAVLAIALVQAAFYMAAGLIIGAALSGSAPSVATGLQAVCVFTLLGLTVLLATYWFLGGLPIFRWRAADYTADNTQYERITLNDAVRRGNAAAALLSASVVLSLGLALRNAIGGDFAGWAASMIGFALTYVVALSALCCSVLLLDKLVVTNATIQDIVCENNTIAAAIMGALIVAASLGASTLAV